MRKTYASLIVAGFAVSLSLGACGGKPSEEDCIKFADKVVELTLQGQEGPAADSVKSMVETMKPEIVKECKVTGTKAELDCAAKATSLADLEKCDGSKKAKAEAKAEPKAE